MVQKVESMDPDSIFWCMEIQKANNGFHNVHHTEFLESLKT